MILNPRYNGIRIQLCDHPLIEGNVVVNGGIRLRGGNDGQIIGNTVDGPIPAGTGVNQGIYVSNYNSTATDGHKILNNTVHNCVAGYAIQITDASGYSPTNTTIRYNTLYDNLHSIYNNSTGPTTIEYNSGYVTENKGVATITASASYVTVTHGMASTPTKIIVTPFGNVGNCWISNQGTTTFRINVSSAPASNTLISWSAEI
jgi:hypothetical protein